MKIQLLLSLACLSIFCSAKKPVKIEVDANKEIGDFKPIWAWLGYDEPNYTYMKNGEKSGQLQMLSKPVKVSVKNNQFIIEIQLPRQAVSLLKLSLIK